MKKNVIWTAKACRTIFVFVVIINFFGLTYSQNLLENKSKKVNFTSEFSMFTNSTNTEVVNNQLLFNLDKNISDFGELFGTSWSRQNSLTFLVPPTISSVSPSSPQTSTSDQNVVVNGSNFVSGLTVTVTFPSGGTGTLSGSQLQNVTSSSFTMRITLNATGTWRIRVNNPNGEQSSQFSFNVTTAQTPSISSVSPSSPTVSNSNQNVQVSGSNFQNGMTVTVFFPGGGSGTLSGTQLQNVTPTSFRMVVTLNLVGTYGIRINNPSGLQSNTFQFQVQAVTPSISSISPSGVCAQNGDRTFTVSGSNFVSGLTVTVFFPGGGSTTLSGSQIQFNSSTSFTMTVTLNVVGTYNFRVNNPSGGASSPNFSYATQNCSPNITSISPSSPTISNSDQTVGVSGSNFQSGLTVTIFFPGGGSGTLQGSQIQFNSSSSFNMIVTLNVVGQYQIRVNNPNGTVSPNFSFNTQAAAPTITSISPSSPCVRNIDQSVTVNGTGFVSGLSVSVTFPSGGTGTLSGSQIQFISSTSFTMLITLADPGNYSIRVINPGGSQSSPFNFTPQNCLSVSGTNPSTPTQSNVNQDVVVNGSGFAANLTVIVTLPDNTTVTLSGAQILNVTSTSFTMRATLNAIGQWKIKVRNPNGDLSNIHTFNVQAAAAPTVISINPTSPTASNIDQNITVNGTNFQQGLTVTVTFPNGSTGTLQGTQIQNVTANSFTMRITLGNAGNWNLRVNNPNGGQSGLLPFTVQSGIQASTIFSINPVAPVARGTDQDVIVSGSNFQQNLVIDITFPAGGGTTLSGAQIQNVTSTSFIMRATLNAAGSWTIKVRNPDGGQSNVFGFGVSSGGNNPLINTINPTTPFTNGADQSVIVSGSNFQANLKVNVTFPSGGMATLQGTGQIQNVTASSFTMRITLNAAGSWTIRVVNPDNSQSQQFAFNVQPSGPPPTGLPTSVLSPVIGSLRVTTSNQGISDGKWEFNQHGGGFHTPTGGVSLSNDRYAWDINLYAPTSGNADVGKPVFAVANGEVVSYVGTAPGGGPGAVLIAHPNAQNPVWFSGYLHMTNVRVTLNQQVNSTTLIGEIGRVGANNDHLHFTVYSGQNTRGNLQSFNVPITERSNSIAPINSINPPEVTPSDTLQLITINGSDFQATSMIVAEDPNGNSFTITPEIVSGLSESAKIVEITATSITARLRFASAGRYQFTVINNTTNRKSSKDNSVNAITENNVILSQGNTNVSDKTPVILIPGIMGSKIAKWNGNTIGEELWTASAHSELHRQLKDNVEDPSTQYREIRNRQVVATEVVRNVSRWGVTTDFYGNLINKLITNEYGAYKLYDVQNPVVTPCQTNRIDADLFVFPYDWRNSNWTSAVDLKHFVDCVKSIYQNRTNNPPPFKVNIIAHSMGGLVARRYILNNPTHYVERMVSLGTPWLGAPDSINVMKYGDMGFKRNFAWIKKEVVKELAPNMKGLHELVPSPAFTDILTNNDRGIYPLGEEGWNNFDNDPSQVWRYRFSNLKRAVNHHIANNPGDKTEIFHNADFDDWRRINTGVFNYNFMGRATGTVGTLIAKDTLWSGKHLELIDRTANGDEVTGDGTVPEVSSRRLGPVGPDYRGNVEREVWFTNTNHGDLTSSGSTFPAVKCVIRAQSPNNCLDQLRPEYGQRSAENIIGNPAYSLKIVGSESVVISDSFGNTSNPLSTSVDEGIGTISTKVSENNYLSATFPLDQNYKAVIKAPLTPFSITLIKSDGQSITQAIRYVDITLPPNVLALIELGPQGVTTLKYDSDGNGTFDTPVNPTINVTGQQAQDIEPPNVFVNETVQNGTSQIVLEANDAGIGVQRIMYSLNGTTFQQYSTPLTLNPVQTPTIYVFADDNVFNRSGLVTHNLTASGANFGVTGPIAAPAGSQITATWSAPSGRPVDDWIGLFRIGTLNSAYISKQYTNGQTSGSLNFNMPNQPGVYELRYLINDGFSSVAASSPITVSTNRRTPFDFDGDSKTDLSIFRPSVGEWWIQRSSNVGNIAAQFGASTDKITPADFTGDGKTDMAFWRPTDGYWYVLRSEDFSFYSFPFGANGDIPAVGDFDADGKADSTVFRSATATWYTRRSSDGGATIQTFGQNGDVPVVADYDGDNKADIAIYRVASGEWWINRSTLGLIAFQFGNSSDKPVQGDYTGDGKADVAIWRPSTGEWFVLRSENQSYYSFPFGTNGDVPAPGDYDGDGKFDATVFRSSNSTWFVNKSTGGNLIQTFGQNGDKPIPSAFIP